ncbi:M1 family metallopeptidase [Emticicia agri]|uniref:M1 family peptidase n=1 Tax=Emticicia agri TaxID=2492393 RepID=A0A4Q5LXB2_9BACT|nr:M1 family metallopeptidase [Emticicia agri]RYU94461.1 M1 family peptidase [Emticicia agri]
MRALSGVLLLIASAVFAQQNVPQRTAIETNTRTIRQGVPMTNSIRKAFAAGTRDFSGKPGQNYWQLEADYTIQASIDPTTQTITGTEKILVHNNSKEDLKNLVLRLDHNIFRPEVPRGFSTPAEATEGMVVTSIKVAGAEIEQKTIRGLNRTIATVPLKDFIKAGTKAEVEIAWHTKLPGGPNGVGHRMTQRFDDKLFQPTQWFPRLAKYDDLRGWETSPYLGPSEFYNNFGRFDVRITVPGGWLVSGTGVLQNPEQVLNETTRKRLTTVLNSNDEVTIVSAEEAGNATVAGDKLTYHFVADKVNDFAWATAGKFIWKATRATIPGKGAIPIYMFYLPERARFFEKAGAITRHALEFYSALWTPYPFPQLTLQDGPSAGMEYPMVINSNQGAADHETGHQWWPMVVGNNETRYGWMDEGFNQYMNILSAADSKGIPYKLDGLGQSYGKQSGDEDEAPMMWSANDAASGYRFQTYGKTPLMLSMLGGIVGDEAVMKAMKEYAKVWSFKHPSPWDYMYFMNNALGQNLDWFWYYWLFTTESVNGSIKEVKTNKDKTIVTVHQAGEMPSPVVLKVEFEAEGPAIKTLPNTKMLDANTAVVTWPVSVWFGGSRTFEAEMNFGKRKIKQITLDPNGRFPDNDTKDNVWPR